jgi:hypothetical protein
MLILIPPKMLSCGIIVKGTTAGIHMWLNQMVPDKISCWIL